MALSKSNELRLKALKGLVDAGVLNSAEATEVGRNTEFDIAVPHFDGENRQRYSGGRVDAFLLGVDAAQHAPNKIGT